MMTPAAAQKEIQRLTKELKQHNYNYYALAQPTISDQDFDHMLEELARLETEFPQFASADSPTQKVGGEIIKSFQTVTHRRSEEHTSELQSLMRISYAVFCLKKKKQNTLYRHYNK